MPFNNNNYRHNKEVVNVLILFSVETVLWKHRGCFRTLCGAVDVWRYAMGNQQSWIEGHTIQWPIEKGQNNKKW
jgi:hypothetical protein